MEKQKEIFTCTIEHGAMTEAPIYDSHSRAKNWLAVIHADPTAPGGIGRTFARRANGDYYYMADSLSIGTPVEFGADYYTGSGRKRSNRWCGVIVDMTDDSITIQKADDARKAIEVAQTVQETATTSEAEFVVKRRMLHEEVKYYNAKEVLPNIYVGCENIATGFRIIKGVGENAYTSKIITWEEAEAIRKYLNQ